MLLLRMMCVTNLQPKCCVRSCGCSPKEIARFGLITFGGSREEDDMIGLLFGQKRLNWFESSTAVAVHLVCVVDKSKSMVCYTKRLAHSFRAV
jgi:hypothetical protein